MRLRETARQTQTIQHHCPPTTQQQALERQTSKSQIKNHHQCTINRA